MAKGPSFDNLIDAIRGKTQFQYYCPSCGHGPYYTKGLSTACPACDVDIDLKWIDGDILVEIRKTT